MDTKYSEASSPSSDKQKPFTKSDVDPMGQNIESILAFYAREERCIPRSQRMLENMLDSMGRPIYISLIILFCVIWILVNIAFHAAGLKPFDEPPYHWLQGIFGLAALLITVVLLIKQNRLTKIEERRAHLELQVNLLTEHKTAKLIKLMMELRRDMPMIKTKRDPEAAAFQKPTSPETVLAALDEHIDLWGGRGVVPHPINKRVFDKNCSKC